MNKIDIIATDEEQEDYVSSGEDWTPEYEEVKIFIHFFTVQIFSKLCLFYRKNVQYAQ